MNTERREQLLGFLAALGLELPHQANHPSLEAQLAPLDEALTHTSAGLVIHHERLEFLGDAVLRLAASEFLERHYPQLSVGQSSALRAQLVTGGSRSWVVSAALRRPCASAPSPPATKPDGPPCGPKPVRP
jgi:ribonuclease-3